MKTTAALVCLGLLVAAAEQVHSYPIVADFVSIDTVSNTATGSFGGNAFEFVATTVRPQPPIPGEGVRGGTVDGTSTFFDSPFFTPSIPLGDDLRLGPTSDFRLTFDQPVTNLILHIYQIADNRLDFTVDGGLGVFSLLSSDGDFTVLSGSTAIVGPPAPTIDDASGSLLFAGTFSELAWVSNAGNTGDGIRVQFSTSIPEPTTLALVDIKPGSFPNSVNLKSKGVLPVVILGTEEFDVNNVNIDTLLFGDPNSGTPLSPVRSALEDVSDDGFEDLSLKFSMPHLVENEALGPDTIEGLLTGALLDGTPFEGMDSIRIVPPNGSNGNNLQTSAVPEPTTLALTALGLLGIGCRRRKR